MKDFAAAGKEVMANRHLLEPIIRKIMEAHSLRRGCEWEPNAMEAILCDLSESVERYERCLAA